MRNFRLNLKYIRHLFFQYRRVLYLLLIVFGFAYPLALFLMRSTYVSYDNLSPYGSIDSFIVFNIPWVILIFLFISAFVVVFIVFSYTNNKANMDNYLSLPISRENLFFNQFVFTFLLVFVPFAIMWVAGWGVGKIVYADLYYAMAHQMNGHYSFFSMLGQLVLIGLFLPVLLGIPFFALVNTPSLVDGVIYGLGLHLLPWFIQFAAYILGERYIWGFTGKALEDSFVGKSRFNLIFFENFVPSKLNSVHLDFWYLVWVVIGLILILINQKLFTKRQVEAIGSNKVNSWFYPLITNLGTYLLLVTLLEAFVFSTDYQLRYFLFPLVGGFIFYFVLDMIRNRGLSRIVKMTFTYLLIFGLAFGSFLLMDVKAGEWFSVTETRNNIKTLEIRFYADFENSKAANPIAYDEYRRFNYYFRSTDPQIIELAKKAQVQSKAMYFRFFGNRWGNQNDVSDYIRSMASDSNYLYYIQQNPSQLKAPYDNLYRTRYYDYGNSNVPLEEFLFLFTDENGKTRAYSYYLPITWMDELLLRLTDAN